MKIKLTAIFILIAMLLPMNLACGDKPEAGSAGNDTPDAVEETPEPTPAPTPAPTEPTTEKITEPPTEPFKPDESLAYWDQIYSELEWYGMKDGVKIFNGEDEAEVMRRFSANGTKKEELDLTGENVPFSAAYTVRTSKDIDNFWEAAYATNFLKDIETAADDIVAGVFWIRGRRTEESDAFMLDEPADYYTAIKSPTDNWASEGQMEPFGRQSAAEEWERIMFTGRVVNEEAKSSDMSFNIYMGYGIQEFDIGGIIAWVFPSTQDNEKAAIKITF